MSKTKEPKWILIRNGEVRQVFDKRRDAIKYFKECLKQVITDLNKQDTHDEYDYPIKVFETEIKPVEERESYLGL